MLKSNCIAAMAALTLAGPVFADVDVLAQKNGWSVIRADNGAGTVWCSLQTRNDLGVKFAWNGSDGRDVTLLFTEASLNFDRGMKRMVVSVDGQGWRYDMLADGPSMTANLRDNPDSGDLMNAMNRGGELVLQHVEDGPELRFDLAGIQGPFSTALDCWQDVVNARG